MMELAITRGTEFVRFTRNALCIVLPDGCTVLGPLVRLPYHFGDFAIRRVVAPAAGAELNPPRIEGDVVVL